MMEISSDEDYSQVESQEEDEFALVSQLGERVAKQLIHAHSLGMVSKKNDLIPERSQRKHWAMVKQRAQVLIRQAFGFALGEIAYDKDVLVFVVDRETLSSSDYIDDECRFQKIFLFVVLGYLTLKGPPVAEGQILEFLRKLGIDTSGESSFGDALSLLSQKLPAQYYLKRTKEVDHSGSGEVMLVKL